MNITNKTKNPLKLAIAIALKTSIYGGIFESKEMMEIESIVKTFDMAYVIIRKTRLRKYKKRVLMEYVRTLEGFEKIGIYNRKKSLKRK